MTEAKKQMLESVLALCAPFGPVVGKAMFGGFGVFYEGLMFALITRQGELYFKADHENRSNFEKAGLKPYGRMPYYEAPKGALASWASLEPWVRDAYDAAKRTAKKAHKPKPNN